MPSRRAFLQLARRAGLLGAGFPKMASALWAAAPDQAPLFEEIPPSASGITWAHDNAMSPARFLPESLSTGAEAPA